MTNSSWLPQQKHFSFIELGQPNNFLNFNYLCNQCQSPLTLWVRIPNMQGLLDITFCDKVCQWFAAGQWFFPGTRVSFTNKTDCHDIIEIL